MSLEGLVSLSIVSLAVSVGALASSVSLAGSVGALAEVQ